MEKEIFAENKFDGKEIVKEGLQRVIHANRDEAIEKVRALFVKNVNTQREIIKAKEVLKKAEDSLKKSEQKIEEVKKGNFSVLFED